MLVEHKLISKILDEGNFNLLKRNNITKDDFTEGQEAFLFLKDYWEQHNDVPSPSTVADECEFEYVDTHDKVEYLMKTVKDNTAKRRSFELLQNQASENFNKMKGSEFVNWLHEETAHIKEATDVNSSNGKNWAINGEERLGWYEEAEQRGSAVCIPTPYKSLNKAMNGGNDLGDYVLLMAYTNQGKSWEASHFGLSAWEGGFGVLHYSPEMTNQQTSGRLDTLQGHFSNVHISSGQLFNGAEYKDYLKKFNEDNETPYVIKTMEDIQNGLTVELIEADLLANPNIKFVIIDGFNLMSHKGRDGNRNNMSSTSRRLRQLFVKYNVTGLIVHHTGTQSRKEQLEETADIEDDFPIAPKLTDYSETVAVTQDAVTVLTFATADGKGKLAVRKARKPCLDFEVNLHVNFNMGYITEVDMETAGKVGDTSVF